MEIAEQFVKVGILYNAFDSSDIQKAELLYQKGNTLADYLVGLPEDAEWNIALNGKPLSLDGKSVDLTTLSSVEVLPDDVITLVLIPQGGKAKDILRLVAMVALVVAATYFLGPASGLVTTGALTAGTAAVLMAVVIVAGTLIINALLPPTMPKAESTSGTNYGYDGAKNTAREGIAIPVVYGSYRVAGNYVDVFTENYGSDQYLYGRTILSDGVIDSVSDIELNEQPIANYQNLEYGHTVGNNTETENRYFGRSIAAQSKGTTLSTSNTLHTTTTPVDAVQFGVAFPNGIVQYDSKGKKKYLSVGIEYGYKLVGAGSYTTGTQTFGGSDTKTLRHTIEVSLPRGQYDLYIRRTTADAAEDGKIFDTVVLTEVAEIQATNIGMRSVATGWYKVKMTDQLNGIPKITWKVKGVKVNRYSNTGTLLANEWSANPAWIVLDMIKGPERGAFPDATIDYQAFYDWAQYCDTNSFMFNGVFEEIESLWDCMAKVYKVGRAMPIRIGTRLSVAVDKPTAPVMMFGAGNIEADTFNISYLPLSDRANEFEVSYYDASDGNKKKSIRIIDPDAESRGEIPRPVSYEMFGIDNFAHAQKEVWYQLYQNRLIKKTITFRAPIESIGLTLGDVALIQHDMVNWGISGRIKQGISTTQVKLDKPIKLIDGDTIMVIFDSVGAETDVIEERTITAVDEVNNIVTVSAPFSQVPQDLHNYMLGNSESVARPFRLRSISGDDLHSRELVFVEYNPIVYSAPEHTIPAPTVKTKIGVVDQVAKLEFGAAVDYADTIEKDVIATVSWTAGHIRRYAGADVYVGLIAKDDYDLAVVTTPTYTLHSTVNNGRDVQVVAEYGDYVFVKVVAFDTNGIRASYVDAPVIFALVDDPIVVTPPKKITDGSEFAYTTGTTGTISWEFLYDGVMADIDGFFVDVQWSETVGFTSSSTERFILNPNQRAIILGNIDVGSYYRFKVSSYKRVHDIFNPTGLATSTVVLANTYPFRPSDTTAYSGDILATITSTNPYTDLLDFINYQPSVTVEAPALVSLTSPTVTVPTDEEGSSAVLTNTGTNIKVTQGATDVIYNGVGTTAGTWRVSSTTATNCTAGAITDGGAFAVVAPLSAITAGTSITTAKLDFVITGKTLGGVDFTLNATQSITKLINAIVDTSAPSTPTGLALSSFVTSDPVSGVPKTTVRATWTASPETDTAGYILAIKEGTGNFVEFKLGTDLAFEFQSLPNVSYTVKIKSYDRRNNISAFSSTVTGTSAKDTTVPGVVTGLAATASFGNIFLSWTNPSDTDLAEIEIYEHTSNASGSSTHVATVNATPSAIGQYTRSGLATGTQRYYWVKTVDTSGNKSAFSSGVNATTVQSTATDIADAAITTAKFASGLTPVEIVGTLPVTGNYVGRIVFLTTDSKLYRWNGTAFVATVPTVDLVGTITQAQIADAAINTAKFAAGIKPVEIVGTLPATGNTQGRVVFLTTDNKLYRWDGTQWITTVPTTDLVGTITQAQIADAAINTAKFASGIKPVEILGTLPATGNVQGRIVFLTTDNKLYRWNGTAWVSTVPATDISGTISDAQIAGIDATKIGGAITSTQITDGAISTPKLSAGAVTAAKITAGTITATQIATGTITAGNIAALTITSNELAANSIIAGKIAAAAVSTTELAANAVTAAKIAAGTITANEIAANTITAGKIAADTITSNEIATNAITSNELSANSVIAGKVAAAAIATTELAASAVTAGKIAAGTITANEIAANTITAGKIAADTITSAEIAANAITSNELAANSVIAGKVQAGAISTDELAANAVNASKIAAGVITTDKMTANTINGDRISAGTLNADKIVAGTITGDRFNTGTSLPGTITVGATGVTIETVRTTSNTANTNATTAINGVKVARSKNLLPMDTFVPGGSVANGGIWSGIEPASDVLALDTGPDGTSETVWKGIASTTGGAGGGWDVNFNTDQGYDPAKTYLYSVWTRRMSDNSTTFFMGCGYSGTQNLSGTTDNNPYWIYHASTTAMPIKGKWYLAVGVLHGSSATTANATNLTGVYDPVTGHRVQASASEFKSASGATAQMQRVYSYYANASGDRIDFARPTVEELSNSPILNIINKAGGENLFPDASFEIGLPAITETSDGGSSTRTLITSGGAVGSANYMRVDTIGGHQFSFTDSGFIARSDKVTISAWIKDSQVAGSWGVGGYPARPHGIYLGLRTSVGGGSAAWQGVTPSVMQANADQSWIRYTQVISGLSVGSTYYVGCTADYNTGSRKVDIDAIMVEHGGTGSGDWRASSVDDPASRVNARTTKIEPGKITISGATTLSDWRNGSDNTKIEGGSIAANTVTANKVSVGIRGITIEGMEFEANRITVGGSLSTNSVAWTAGTISYTNDAGTNVSVSIGASYATWSSGTVYIYWGKGNGGLSSTNTLATANGVDNVIVATYRGGTDLVVTYGRTIIDGNKITTGSISANKLSVTSLDAITGTIGLLRTASSGARTEIESNMIRVYDSSGTLRVKLGVWT